MACRRSGVRTPSGPPFSLMTEKKKSTTIRIIGGIHRGRRIKINTDFTGRPTKDLVREALFDIIGPDIKGKNFLDLFAGTGANGIEAISRGAKKSWLIDMSMASIRVCMQAVKILGVERQVEIKRSEAGRFLSKANRDGLKFDIIFSDAPYAMKFEEFEEIIKNGIPCLTEFGYLVVEVEADSEYPENILNLRRTKVKRYGRTKLCFYESVVSGNI